MIDWSTLEFEAIWPLWLFISCGAGLLLVWLFGRSQIHPDLQVIKATQGIRLEWTHIFGGITLLLLITSLLAQPSVVIEKRVMRDARDFLVLVDTSRSMRHDTEVRRGAVDMHFERRANGFLEVVDKPDNLPFVARFELARESLYRFFSARRNDDRVGLLYFNDQVHPVSGLSKDIGFVTEQLAGMDDFVNWGTNIGEAMRVSLDLLARYPGNNRRTLILITDAEARYSEVIETQFERLQDANLTFYLLWITADTADIFSDDATALLNLAETAGGVFTVRNPDASNLHAALQSISRSESYAYEEMNRVRAHLAHALIWPIIVIFLIWHALAVTVWFPRGRTVLVNGLAS